MLQILKTVRSRNINKKHITIRIDTDKEESKENIKSIENSVRMLVHNLNKHSDDKYSYELMVLRLRNLE